MDKKIIILMLGLFIIYSLYRKNIMKGGENNNIVPGDLEGKYERLNPTPGNSYHFITFTRNLKEGGFTWTLKSNFGWFVNKNLIPTGINYPYKNTNSGGKKINIKMNKNNEVIGLTSSEGEYFNRVGNLKNTSNEIDSLKKYSIEKLEEVLKIKKKEFKIKNELNNLPKIHSRISNYELYVNLGGNDISYDIIKSGTYWADEVLQLTPGYKYYYNNLMNLPLEKREETYYIIKKKLDITKTMNNDDMNNDDMNKEIMNEEIMNEEIIIREIRNMENMNKENMNKENMNKENMNKENMNNDDMNNDDMNKEIMNKEIMNKEIMNKEIMNNEIMNKENMTRETVLCNNKSKSQYCDGFGDCWKSNYCECPEAQKLCKKNIINKIYEVYDISEEEHRDKILGIFHGNSNLLHKLETKPKTMEPSVNSDATPTTTATWGDIAPTPPEEPTAELG